MFIVSRRFSLHITFRFSKYISKSEIVYVFVNLISFWMLLILQISVHSYTDMLHPHILCYLKYLLNNPLAAKPWKDFEDFENFPEILIWITFPELKISWNFISISARFVAWLLDG
jgi:hypothetical protein